MLSDEEKKAIEILGEFKKNGFHLLNLKYESRVSTTKHIENSIETILNLIEKQSKEIEELKEKYSKKLIEFQKEREWYEKNHISKDKIKAKIEEVQQRRENDGECELALYGFQREAKIEVLQSLLEKE